MLGRQPCRRRGAARRPRRAPDRSARPPPRSGPRATPPPPRRRASGAGTRRWVQGAAGGRRPPPARERSSIRWYPTADGRRRPIRGGRSGRRRRGLAAIGMPRTANGTASAIGPSRWPIGRDRSRRSVDVQRRRSIERHRPRCRRDRCGRPATPRAASRSSVAACRVPVRVAARRPRRPRRVGRTASRNASVDDVRLPWWATLSRSTRGQPALEQDRVDLLLDVAHEQEPPPTEGAQQHDRHVVDAGPAVRRFGRDASRRSATGPASDLVEAQPRRRPRAAPCGGPPARARAHAA